jgi:hypothetical protein
MGRATDTTTSIVSDRATAESRVNLAAMGALNGKLLMDITKNTPARAVPPNMILSGRGFYSDTRSIVALCILIPIEFDLHFGPARTICEYTGLARVRQRIVT